MATTDSTRRSGSEGLLEHAGVERIDEEARTGTPWTFFVLFLGSGVALGSVLYGWFPITYGLGFWSALSSIAAGTLIGQTVLIPLILIGSRTATNNTTSSGAHFGVRGRLLGSFLGLAITLLTAAPTIWTGGGVTVGAFANLFDTSTSDAALAVAYALIALAALVIAVCGYRLLTRTAGLVMVLGGVLLVLMPIAFAGDIDTGYKGGEYLLGDFWKTWLLSALTAGVAGIMLLSTIFGDWTRYISAARFPTRRLLPALSLATFVGYFGPPAFGTLVTTAFADPFAPFPVSLAAAAPTWYAAILLPLGLIGSLGLASVAIYSAGLDLDAIVPRLTRPIATAIMSVFTLGLIFLGAFVWDAAESISAALLILLALVAPWAAIVGVGFLRCRGRYRLDDLQVFNRGQTGGAYWYTGGWNWRAALAWAVGATWGVLAANTTLYTGRWPTSRTGSTSARGLVPDRRGDLRPLRGDRARPHRRRRSRGPGRKSCARLITPGSRCARRGPLGSGIPTRPFASTLRTVAGRCSATTTCCA